ncbi:MAG: SDR family oxidoreductase [Deltaproteobacteria bacterium]|nr:SDR family oxidoreductase [Deltaproteobacteria bacterium]MCB9489842.1 SDR family oxidoreductase [Deltaproteobacteria bacterium]
MPSVLITGANRGLGLEFVSQLALDHFRVHACCRDPKKADALNALAAEHPELISVHRMDVTDDADIAAVAKELADAPIDILINNAGIYGPETAQRLGDIDYDGWRRVLETNVLSPMKVTRALLPNVKKSKRKIIAVLSSQMGSIGQNESGGHYIYRSSKAAVNAVFKSLSVDLREEEVTVVMLHPGWVKTDMGGPRAPLTADAVVGGMLTLLENLDFQDSGRFLTWEEEELPW